MNYYRPPTFSLFPPVVKNLLMANIVFFVATLVLQSGYNIDLSHYLGLHFFQSPDFKPYQIITYMFIHGGWEHIIFNMFALWMFGYSVENLWGDKKFLVFYFICGIGAAFTQELTQYFYFQNVQHAIDAYAASPMPSAGDCQALLTKYFVPVEMLKGIGIPDIPALRVQLLHDFYHAFINEPTVGASGAIFGILLAFGMSFPNMEVFFLFFPFPIKAKYAVMIYGAVEIYAGFSNRPGDNVAHFAHIGGLVAGFLVIMYWRTRAKINT